MHHTDLTLRALAFATAAHASIDHRRKYDGEPYIVHPVRVAETVAKAGGTPEMIAAALLHDVVEDTPVTQALVDADFGLKVGRLVEELTDVSRPSDGNRKVRKAIDRDHSGQASADGQTIKVADLLDNGRDIMANDPDFAIVFMHEKALLLEVLKHADPVLLAEAWAMVRGFEEGRLEAALTT